ncbi:flagellar basal body P-ring formation chaperone FlgA [Blastomonas aquatica]|uniref:Flagella basal body P-ring formation protein FlgA n=1 Tax=Blastomonas aquatica TaxID=1510276 RepID=A0ABQ1JRB2_9SPHN|nr:flagellar basal body P-ring formation chaperone FlgA [Blastomonas aquatica]GGB74408.1 hypothetical protein GCM10010833_32030 [Blastomonas aquatica]
MMVRPIVLAALASALLPVAPLLAQAAAPMASTDVLARTVQRGEVLAAGDFTSTEIPVAQARDAMSAQQAAGREARRTLRGGLPVRAGDLGDPRVILRGDPVTIRLRSGALTISANGRALADAARGKPLRVFNEATNQTLDAIAEEPGVVRVTAR